MNIELDKVLEVVEMTQAEVRMIERIFGMRPDTQSTQVRFETLLILLIWDFFKRSGMALESFAAALPPFKEGMQEYAGRLLTAIELYAKERKTNIPRCFVTLIDNRFVGIYFDSKKPIELYDMVTDKFADALVNYKPVFTLTLSVPMLYFKVAARNFGHSEIAEASKSTTTWGGT